MKLIIEIDCDDDAIQTDGPVDGLALVMAAMIQFRVLNRAIRRRHGLVLEPWLFVAVDGWRLQPLKAL